MQTLLKRGFSPTTQSVNLLLSSLLRAGKYQLLLHLFSQVSSNSVLTNSHSQTLVAHAFLGSGQFREAEDLIFRGESSHFCCKRRLWDALIREVCTVGKDPEKGFALLLEFMGRVDLRPSVRTFRSLAFSFCLQGRTDRAIEVVEMMTSQKVGYSIDGYLCSSIISGLYEIGKPDLAQIFLENAGKDNHSSMYNDVIVILQHHPLRRIRPPLHLSFSLGHIDELLGRCSKSGFIEFPG